MALNISKCNYLTSLRFKELKSSVFVPLESQLNVVITNKGRVVSLLPLLACLCRIHSLSVVCCSLPMAK